MYTCNLWKRSLVHHRSASHLGSPTHRHDPCLLLSRVLPFLLVAVISSDKLACPCKCKQSTGLISWCERLTGLTPSPTPPPRCHLIPVASLNRLLCHVLLSAAARRHPCTGTDKRQSGGFGSGDTHSHTQTHTLQGALLS